MLKEIFRPKEKDTGGNTGLPKGMKNTGNDRNMGKHTSFFLIQISLENNWLFNC